jgi:D-alanyl-D-alanine carboxypeptidase/D-alanyl-D-alanine-endopeptidase (penicillin-binding protein 4)
MSVRCPRLLLTLAICCVLLGSGCAKSQPKVAPPVAATATASAGGTAVARLQQELAAAFDNPSINAIWAVQVQSLDSGEILYERNAHTLVMPASNMKLVTMSVAAARLGWDFRFATQLASDGPIANGTLSGDLIVIGSGDPTISDRGGDASRVFQSWADQLKAQGITHITGRIVGDDDALDDQQLGDGWAWDDLVFGYSTAGGALQFNEDIVKATIRPGAAIGQAATITLAPEGSGLTVRNLVTTITGGASGTSGTAGAPVAADISLSRRPGSTVLEFSGTISLGGRDITREAAVENPTQFFVNALREVLVRSGITVDGAAVDIDNLKASASAFASASTSASAPDAALALDKRHVLFTHQSAPLASEEVATTFMKVSQNLFGETLMATIGKLAPPPDKQQHPTEAARKLYEDTLSSWGVPPTEHIIVDGSGLSRYNYLTANLLVHILRAMARDPKFAGTFEALLPIAGKDGTLRNRMKGTKAEGNVHAKTGTLASVRSLSGYLRTADNERIAFSIIANNFKAPTATIDNIAELAVERLSNFTRAAPASTQAPAPAAPHPAAR